MRVSLAEDYALFRELVRTICERELGHTVVSESDNGPEAIAATFRWRPDLLLLDIELPGCDGFDVLDRIRELPDPPKVVVLAARCDECTIRRTQTPIVRGFLDKPSSTLSTLRDCLSAVAAGGVFYSEVYRSLRTRRAIPANQWLSDLVTCRERQILTLVGGLLEDAEISQRLNISVDTVEKHRFNIQKKFSVKTRMELVRRARDLGFMAKRVQPDS